MKYLFTIACLAASVLAAPAPPKGTFEWTPTLAGYMDVVFSYIQQAKSGAASPTCDLAKAAMPVAPTPLPTPSGLTLQHVALGRGVQNYTCANATATPAAVGAVARFYNVSCVASDWPDLLPIMPNLALQYPLPADPTGDLEPSNLVLTTHHYFANTTTPVFAFDAPESPDFGRVFTQKVNSSEAPTNSVVGPNGQGNGAVAWLYLTSRADTVSEIKAVYRLSTAGGNPPATCQGQDSAFSVDYSALYWFYS